MINTFSAFFMRRRNWTIPYVLFLAIFVVIPLLLIVYYAFTNDEGMFTFANFRKFMIHPEAINTFVYSVGIALITTILCLLLGYPAAWILSQARFNTSRTMVVLFILPMWVNILIRTLATVALFDFLNFPLGEGALIFGMVYNFLPFMIYPIYNTLQKMDHSLIEAAQDLGANPSQVFIKAVFPLSMPGVMSGIMMVFMPTISTFAIAELLTMNNIKLFGTTIQENINNGMWNYGAALSLIMLLLIGITGLFSNESSDSAYLMVKYLAKGYLWALLLLLYSPILIIMIFSFTEAKVLGNWTGFSTKLYSSLFAGNVQHSLVSALWNTFAIAMIAATVSTLLGSVAAIGIFNLKARARNAVSFVNNIPMLNPDIITGISLFLLFVSLGISQGLTTVVLAHITFCTPYVVLSVMPRLKQMNQNIYEAALDLGATPFQALRKVIFPEIRPGMISGFILAFTLSIDDFAVTIFTIGNEGLETLSTFIYADARKGGLTPELRPLSTIIFVTVLVLLIVINKRAEKAKRA